MLRKYFSSVTIAASNIVRHHNVMDRLRQDYPRLYAKIFIFNFPFTVTKNDLLVTHRIRDVRVGDVVELDQVREVGGPTTLLKGSPLLKPGLVKVLATVMEHGRGAKQEKQEHKQRKGRRPCKRIKPHSTTLRIQDILISKYNK